MDKKILYIVLLGLLVQGACHKKTKDATVAVVDTADVNNLSPPPPPPPPPPPILLGQEGVFKDQRRLDGCGWMIELGNGTKLQPFNLADFKVTPFDGKRVKVVYELQPKLMSTCMSGKMAKIKQLEEY